MNKLLISLSGARPEILQQCPTERVKFQSLGWAILITSGLATVSMWFALYSAMGVNPVVAVLPALLWGLVIMGIDRWLITSITPGGTRRFAIALPRLLLAVLLGSLISTPLVLRIFESEINAQITVIKQQRASQFLAQQQHSQVGAQVALWTKNVANLQKVIASGGQVALDPYNDPVIQGLLRQQTQALAQKQKYYQQWQCQLYGGSGCPAKGNGPLAHASEQSYNQASAQVNLINNEIQARQRELSATDKASESTRYQQAKSALPTAQQQLSAAQARENQLQTSFDKQNETTNGLLIRLQALSDLTGKNFTLNAARLLLFLLFLVIECLPVSVKLLQQPGNYEKILQVAADKEFKDAQKAYRTRPARTGTAFSPPSPGRTVPNTDAASTARRQQVRQQELRNLWGRTQPEPARASSATQPPPAAGPERTEDPAGRSRLDDAALREMEDIRSGAGSSWPNSDSDWRGPGIDLHYNDDDL